MAGTMDKIKAKVDNVMHKDKTTTGTHGTTTGSHAHGDPTGPHSSHMANKADPRVDSDHYGTTGNTSGAGGVGAGQYGSNTGTHTGSGITHGNAGYSDPTGPHDSHLANKADPRVDSDRYGAAGNTGSAGGVGAGQYGSTGTHGNAGYSDPTGPHDSHLANKADPRVDSDRYGAAGNTAGAGGVGAGQYGSTGTHGTTGSSGLTGNHGTTGTHGTHTGATPGSGNSSKTAGPHNSNLMNKLDPRVDSDLDGSKTTGGNATYR